MHLSSPHIPPFLRRLLKYLAAMMTGFLVLLGLGFLFFLFNKDQIKQSLLRYVQEHQQGEIYIGEIQFSPLSHLPYITLRLDEVCYYEHPSGDRSEDAAPILEVDHAYLGFNLLPLFKGRYDIREVSLRDGRVNLIFYPDNSVNLLRALGVGQVRSEKINSKASPAPDIDLLLNELRLRKIKVRVVHQRLNMRTEVDVEELSAGLHYRQGVDDVRLEAGLKFGFLQLNEKEYLREKAVQLDLDFTFDEQSLVSHIRKSRLIFEGLAFDMSGTYDFRESGRADLHLDASDEDLTLLSYLIEDNILNRNLDMLQKGNVYLRGRIRGKTINHIPEITFRFGAENINLDIPGQQEGIEQLGFSGFFSTGEADNFSETVLRIDRIHGRLPGGQITGGLEVVNFTDPLLTASCRLNADVAGWDRIFKLGSLQQLSGRISLNADVENRKLFRPEKLLGRTGVFQLEITGAGFRWPGFPKRFEAIDMLVEHRGNRLVVEYLSMRYGVSELLASGSVGNVLSYLFRPSSGVFAQLELQARQFSPSELPPLKMLADRLPRGRISSLQFDLSLNTAADLSPASPALIFSDLTAYFRGGRIRGAGELYDLKKPVLSAGVVLENFPVQGWEKLFRPYAIDSLSGLASLSFQLDGWRIAQGFRTEKIRDYRLHLKNAGFHLPGFPHRFQAVEGVLTGKGDQLKTDGIRFRYAESQCSLELELNHLFRRLTESDSLWEGHLKLTADRARFRDWPYFDTLSAEIAREEVRNLQLDLLVKGQGKGLRHFPWARHKEVTVRQLRGDFELIPDIDYLQGAVTFTPKGKRGVDVHIQEIKAGLPFGKIKLRGGRVSVEKGLVSADTRLALGGFRPQPLVQRLTGKESRPFTYAPFDAGFSVKGDYHLPSRSVRGLKLEEGKAHFIQRDTVKMALEEIKLKVDEAVFSQRHDIAPWLSALSADLSVGRFRTGRMNDMSIQMKVEGRSDYYAFEGSLYQFSEVLEEGMIELDLSGDRPAVHLSYHLENIPVEKIVGKFQRRRLLSGPVNVTIDLSTRGLKSEEWLCNAEGSLSITGEALQLYGMDLDAQLVGFRKTESFHPVSLGAYFLAGPFGALVAGGRDVLDVFDFRPRSGKKTLLNHFVSEWTFHEGRVETHDAGLVTAGNRLALDACIDLRSDSIEHLRVSVLDQRGCSLLEQTLSGSFSLPLIGSVQRGALFPGSSTNLVEAFAGAPCEGGYSGVLKHPEKKE